MGRAARTSAARRIQTIKTIQNNDPTARVLPGDVIQTIHNGWITIPPRNRPCTPARVDHPTRREWITLKPPPKSHARAGQALRGSSEIHAWGDSNLYVRRRRERLTLTVEHRAAPPIENIDLALRSAGAATALHVIDTPTGDDTPVTSQTPRQRIIRALADTTEPLDIRSLRAACRMRTTTLCDTLNLLKHDGTVVEHSDGYLLG